MTHRLASAYKFVARWTLDAPIEAVWGEVHRPDDWPKWWRGPVRRCGFTLLAASLVGAPVGAQAPKQKFVPKPVLASNLTVRLDLMGRIPTKTNPTSPAVAGSELLLIDQGGFVYRWTGTRAVELLGPSTTPPGLKVIGQERVTNVAANAAGSKIYVMFTSTTAPNGIPRRTSPRDGTDAWSVLFEYDFDGTSLSHAKPITAMQIRTDGHTGGGLTVLDDGSVLFSPGDNGDSYEDGRDYSQNPANHLAKIVKVQVSDGSTRVVAAGVRACQRLVIYHTDGDARLDFVDPGGWVSDELNSIGVTDLIGARVMLNFGWGRSPIDGRSREGSFYIDNLGNAVGPAPVEPGFQQPIAEVGREGTEPFAISGPVSSTQTFSTITSLFGDLVSGSVYAVTGPLSTARQSVYRVNLVDSRMQTITLKELTGGQRPDPRFFNFPDGSAGVLLERTGDFYRLTQVPPK
jgi:hypothetical protein